jgi:lycopene beta-cyclase
MAKSGKFKEKTILFIRWKPKKTNDRTWCFWQIEKAREPSISKKWDSALFANADFKI